MAEGEKPEAFEAIGRIEIDLEKLKESLDKAHNLVKENSSRTEATLSDHAKKITDHIKKLPGGGVSEGGPGGEGPGGGGGEGGGRHSPTAEFAHIARIVRHDLTPALARLNPQLAEFITAGAASARTAVFFGGAIGAIAIAGAVVSTILGKYIDKAKEMTTATIEAQRSIATLDMSRAESGVKKITEAIAEYNVQADIAAGKVEAGFWQRIIAMAAVATEAVTGSIDEQMKKMKMMLAAQAQIGWETLVPKGIVQAQKDAAELFARQAQDEVKQAQGIEGMSAAYDMLRRSIEAKSKVALADLNLSQQIADKQHARDKALIQGEITKATATKKTAEDTMKDMLTTEEARTIAASTAKAAAEKIDDLNQAMTLSDDTHAQKSIKNKNDIKKAEADLTQSLKENTEARAAALLKETQAQAQYVAQVLQAEEAINTVRRNDLGAVETEAHMNERLRISREAALIPLQTELEQIEARGDARKKDLEQKAKELDAAIKITAPGTDEYKANVEARKELGKELEELEVEQASATAKKKKDISLKELELQGKEEAAIAARNHALVEQENKAATHRVRMGRQTYAQEESRLRMATVDPRRTLDEQRSAEEELFALKKQYAEQYFKLMDSLGQNTWAQQLTYAEDTLSKTAEGSKEWFDAVEKVANVYKQIHDTAKGIFQTQASIAEDEARRHGRTRIRRSEIGTYFNQARERAMRELGGDQALPFGELSKAMGVMDVGRRTTQMGLQPGQAFALAMQNPQQQLAETLGRVSSQATPEMAAKEGMTVIGESAREAAGALRDLADAARSAAGAFGKEGATEGTVNGKRVSSERKADAGENLWNQSRLDKAESELAGKGSYRDTLDANGNAVRGIPPSTSGALGRNLLLDNKRAPAIQSDL